MTQDASKAPESVGQATSAQTPTVGRNEPCPCGSGKKYKRCHGVDAAPKLSAPKTDTAAHPFAAMAGGLGGAGKDGAPGFTAEQNQMMVQVAQLMQRLPKGQLQRLQSIMQRAMAGKDVRREAAEFESSLPPAFQELLKNMQMPGMEGGMPGMGAGAPVIEAESTEVPAMTEEEARALVAKAAAQGKISSNEAQKLLDASADKSLDKSSDEKSGGLSKFFKKFK